ncbi:MAG TPA: hypothetical protein PKJ28_01065 [Bacteroidales bacterium]|nr:hypothetical protein [Bacteroidales bacterium]HPS72700.1 hypothetical protein [Bacteroidales bacterium]
MQRTSFVAFSFMLVASVLFASCSHKSVPASSEQEEKSMTALPGPPCIIYKTRADYSDKVPVELTADKSRLSSFPDVADILSKGDRTLPTQLADGFWLDNRGIGPNVAFLKFTYSDYRALDETPSADNLFQQIIDKDPLLEMYQCGNRSKYVDIVNELNVIIRSGKLANCRKLK